MRMLMNNLDPDVAENPDQLVVYGGTGRAARSWEAFDAIVRSLRELENNETLLVQSGKPVGKFRTHEEAPRVLIANSNLVGQWNNYVEFNRLERMGLSMYGQMTAGSWIYIGSQGIVQGTFETFAAAGRKHFGGSLDGKFILTGGLGGMGGAQPLAATMNGALFLGVEVDPARIEKRLKSGYCDKIAWSLDEALKLIDQARKDRKSLSVGLVGNCADVLPEIVKHDVVPDVLTDQTSAHDALNGYVPHGMSLEDALVLRRKNPEEYIERAMHSMGVHVEAMLALQKKGAVTFDYGNNIRAQAKKAGVKDAFDIPGFVFEYIRPLFCEGRGPCRWVALSGDPADIARTDKLALELFPKNQTLARWLKLAKERIHYQGLPARICWLGYGERAEFGVAINELVKRGDIKAPIEIGHCSMLSSTLLPARLGCRSTMAVVSVSVFRSTRAWSSWQTAQTIPSIASSASSPAIPAQASSATPTPATPAPSNSLLPTRSASPCSRKRGIDANSSRPNAKVNRMRAQFF